MTHTRMVRRLSLATFLMSFAAAAAPPQTTDPPVPVASVDPPIPRAAGTPCVVQLFRDQELFAGYPTDPGLIFSYAPPAGCRGPWAKVILRLDLSADRDVTTPMATLLLGGRSIFQGGMPDFPNGGSWHAERDLTDISSLLMQPHQGKLRAVRADVGPGGESPLVGTARLVFYRSSSSTPAPRTPDATYHVISGQAAGLQLPHNIVRAYLDVYNAATWWFTCLPDSEPASDWPLFTTISPGDNRYFSLQPPSEGCAGGSFGEVRVSIDGTPAGVAPYYPRLSADFNHSALRNTIDLPAPPPQMLNVTPYRVDLTPFAAVLNEAGAHTISLDGRTPVDAQLLVYQDKRLVRVSGAVTLNTLTNSNMAPVVTNTLAAANDLVQGDITTALDHHFEIKGYVYTSRGRIQTDLTQDSQFLNVQSIRLDGLVWPYVRSYGQHLTLESTTQQRSRRTVNGSVISDDTFVATYPLVWNYDMAGEVYEGDGEYLSPTVGQASVDQGRAQDATQVRLGLRYESHLRDHFTGANAPDSTGTGRTMQSFFERRFWDNQGSCRYAALNTSGGQVTSTVQGSGCPSQTNRVRWFAHPDGSPDSLGWAH